MMSSLFDFHCKSLRSTSILLPCRLNETLEANIITQIRIHQMPYRNRKTTITTTAIDSIGGTKVSKYYNDSIQTLDDNNKAQLMEQELCGWKHQVGIAATMNTDIIQTQ